LLKLKSTWPGKTTGEVAHMKRMLTNPPGDCKTGGARVVGSDVVMGEAVSMVQLTVGLQNGTGPTASSLTTCCGGKRVAAEVLTTWRAPRLGCESLKYQVEVIHPDGTPELAVVGGPTRLDFGEPDARWFDEGSDYIEGKPSDHQTKFLEQMGIAEDDQMRRQARTLDDHYRGSPPPEN
jgi:hypothetical protein